MNNLITIADILKLPRTEEELQRRRDLLIHSLLPPIPRRIFFGSPPQFLESKKTKDSQITANSNSNDISGNELQEQQQKDTTSTSRKCKMLANLKKRIMRSKSASPREKQAQQQQKSGSSESNAGPLPSSSNGISSPKKSSPASMPASPRKSPSSSKYATLPKNKVSVQNSVTRHQEVLEPIPSSSGILFAGKSVQHKNKYKNNATGLSPQMEIQEEIEQSLINAIATDAASPTFTSTITLGYTKKVLEEKSPCAAEGVADTCSPVSPLLLEKVTSVVFGMSHNNYIYRILMVLYT